MTPFILLFTAGGFIYIATVSIMPELLHVRLGFQGCLDVWMSRLMLAGVDALADSQGAAGAAGWHWDHGTDRLHRVDSGLEGESVDRHKALPVAEGMG